MSKIKIAFVVLLALTLGFSVFMMYAYANAPDESMTAVSYWHIVHKIDSPTESYVDLDENPEAVDPYLLQALELYLKYNRTEDLPPDMPVPNITLMSRAHFDDEGSLVYPAEMWVWSDEKVLNGWWTRIDNYNTTRGCLCKYKDTYFGVGWMEVLGNPNLNAKSIGPAVFPCLGGAWVGLGIVAYKRRSKL